MSEHAYRTILFTHNDLDGAGCRLVFSFYSDGPIGDKYDIVICTNGNIDTKVKEYLESGKIDKTTWVWFADIVPSRNMLTRLFQIARQVDVRDHHRTNFFAEHVLKGNSRALIVPTSVMGIDECGTSLLYHSLSELHDAGVPEFCSEASNKSKPHHWMWIGDLVDNIRSYDTNEWRKTDNKIPKRLHVLLGALNMDFFCDCYMTYLNDPEFSGPMIPDATMNLFIDARLYAEEQFIREFNMQDIKSVRINGKKVALLMKPAGAAGITELADRFLPEHPEFDYMAQMTLTEGGRIYFRTIREDLDLGTDIARPLGGGGHPGAAGTSLPEEFKRTLEGMLVNFLIHGDVNHRHEPMVRLSQIKIFRGPSEESVMNKINSFMLELRESSIRNCKVEEVADDSDKRFKAIVVYEASVPVSKAALLQQELYENEHSL